jgi:enolase
MQTRRRAQLTAIDLVLEQSHALASLVKKRANSTTAATEGAVAVVQQTVDQAVAAQKKALDNSVAQTKAAFETAKKQFGLTGTPVEAAAESFQRGVDSLIETQKELLDIAAKPFASVQ